MKRVFFKISLSVVIIALVSAAVLLTIYSKPCFKIVQDESWKLIMPESEIKAFRKSLASSGIRLSVTTVKTSEFTEKVLSEYSKCRYLLFSPVLSSLIKTNGIDTDLSGETFTIGIGNNDLIGTFDFVIESGEFIVSDFVDETITAVENTDLSEYRSYGFEDNTEYAVDYRFTLAVPQKNLSYVVCPDLFRSVSPLLEGENTESGVMFYVLRKV